MTPDELRREANRLRLVADLNGARAGQPGAERSDLTTARE